MISLSHVCKSYALAHSTPTSESKQFAVQDVSLTVPEGKTLILLGSSGSGKSTLLKMINRLEEPTSGTIEIDNKNIRDYNPVELRRRIGYVFQAIGLFPHLTIERNIGLVLKLQGMSKEERLQQSHDLLNSVGMAPAKFAKRYPAELSGGQQQRVGVARALATNSTYLLMDEPFGAVDAVTRDHLQQLISELRDKFNKTIIFVTHDINEAIRLGDQIAVMHQGQLQQVGTANELINKPASQFVADLFASQASV